MNNNLSLVIDGTAYTGWKSAQIIRSIEAICGGFSFAAGRQYIADGDIIPITPGMSCTVKYGNDTLITGYIDNVDPSGSPQEHSITVSGRDKTQDLVDCSVIDCPAEFRNQMLYTILWQIIKPYGIKMAMASGSYFTVEKFSISPGEKCFEAIDRLCRSVGFFPTVNFNGQVVPARAGTVKIGKPLVYGRNIKTYSATCGISERFSRYILLAQNTGSDNSDAATIAQIKAEALDPSIYRNRTLKIIAEKAMTTAEAKIRAQWEAAVRAGRSGSVNVTVQGWRDETGALWDHNKLIDIYLPPVFGSEFYQEFLIVSTSFSISDKDGTTTQLTLRRKDSCLPEPLKAGKPGAVDPWSAIRKETGSTIR